MHKVAYRFIVVPPAHFDGARYHLNLKLAEKHISYERASISVLVALGEVERVYVHSPDYLVRMLDDKVMIEEQSLADQLLELELVLDGVAIMW